MTNRLAPRLLSFALCLGVAVPARAWAAPPRRQANPPAAPATDGRTVAVLRFGGAGEELRNDTVRLLEEQGFTVKSIALAVEDAAKTVKCRKAPTEADCLKAIGSWLNQKPKTAADFILFGGVQPGAPARAEIVVFDIAKQAQAVRVAPVLAEQDFIAPIVVPQAVVQGLARHVEPPAPLTAEEQQLMAELDEPKKTPEELAQERQALAKAEAEAGAAEQDQVIDTSDIPVDLRADFKEFCRNEPRRKRQSKEDPRDLRPSCKRGPFWGYWQPRSWVTLGLAVGAAAATIGFYGGALGAYLEYDEARDNLNSYLDDVGGDPRRDPRFIRSGDRQYDDLANEVSRTGGIMRRRAIIGDVLLGTTALVTGVLGIMIYQDRSDAKAYIRQEKGLRAISNVRVAPIITQETKGMGLGFRF